MSGRTPSAARASGTPSIIMSPDCCPWTQIRLGANLAGNRTNTGARTPREGIALCQGIIACGSCGKPMRINYHSDQRPAYECSGRADRATTPTCRSVTAATVDDAVAGRLLAALNPHEVELALAAPDAVADRHHRIGRAAELAVETRPLRGRPRRTSLPRC